MIDPNLGRTLRSDCTAIDNDLQHAAALTLDFQNQIRGKAKEIAHLKWLVEKTRANHAHLQEGIARLREERHSLANEAMRAMGLDLQLKKITADRNRIQAELHGVLNGLSAAKAEATEGERKRDRKIVELTLQVVKLKQALQEAQRTGAPTGPVQPKPKPDLLAGGDIDLEQECPEVSFLE